MSVYTYRGGPLPGISPEIPESRKMVTLNGIPREIPLSMPIPEKSRKIPENPGKCPERTRDRPVHNKMYIHILP
jgi:hypothetical protein